MYRALRYEIVIVQPGIPILANGNSMVYRQAIVIQSADGSRQLTDAGLAQEMIPFPNLQAFLFPRFRVAESICGTVADLDWALSAMIF